MIRRKADTPTFGWRERGAGLLSVNKGGTPPPGNFRANGRESTGIMTKPPREMSDAIPLAENQRRRHSLVAAAFMVLLLACVHAPQSAPGPPNKPPGEPPNIVLIVADYMGYADIEPYGATDIRTPSLKELAAGGVRFTNYYAAAPVCGPSRASLLSGRYPAKVGVEDNISTAGQGLAPKHSTLVRELKAQGYKTALVGKWHLGSGPTFEPTSHGFDTFFGFHTWTLGYHTHLTPDGEPGLYRGRELVTESGYLTDMFTDEANRFINKNSDRPFFLYLAYNTGLPPYQGPKLPKSEWETGWDVNEATREDYVAMVEAMDRGIGRVLDNLRRLQLAENTLVLFTYDHGGRHLVNSDPLFHGFATLWEGGIRVPLIIRWPGRLAGNVSIDKPAIAMDVTTSMLDAVGRPVAALGLDGRSLFPMIENPKESRERTFFWRIGRPRNPMKAVRRGNWKYVVDGSTQLLFDLGSDIGESHSVFAKHTDIASELRDALAGWERSLGAVAPE